MSDDYHWSADPATLVTARLTKEEAEALASYRLSKEGSAREGTRNAVVVFAVSEEAVGGGMFERVERAASRAVVNELSLARKAVDAGLHHVKVRCPLGESVFTTVEVDGQEMRGVTFVSFEIGPIGYDRKAAVLTLQMYADVEIEGEPEIVKQWRRMHASGADGG